MLRTIIGYFAPIIREGEKINPDWFTELLENIVNSVEKNRLYVFKHDITGIASNTVDDLCPHGGSGSNTVRN